MLILSLGRDEAAVYMAINKQDLNQMTYSTKIRKQIYEKTTKTILRSYVHVRVVSM